MVVVVSFLDPCFHVSFVFSALVSLAQLDGSALSVKDQQNPAGIDTFMDRQTCRETLGRTNAKTW